MIQKVEIKPGVFAEVKDIICPKCKTPGKKYSIIWGNGTKAAIYPIYQCDCWNKEVRND